MQAALLEEAFLNFAMNAIEAMHADGTLELATELLPGGQNAGVRIRDTGPGMDPKTRKRFGKPFHTSKKSGMGLGVYFAFEVLKSHAAQTRVDSKPGQGTVITIIFPTTA
jgi:signal transduction histidine kinase